MPELTNRQILLRRRPTGLVQPDDTELVTNPAPEPADGEALVRTTYIGMDAAARTWLDGQPGYLPALQLGDVIRAAGIGEVVASRCDAYAVGDVVTTLTGFQEYVIIRDDVFSTPIPGEDDQLAIMSVYGPTGATAYFGMTDIGRPQPGETVVVSAAAGATGSVAGQIAKIAGARVVGIAGGPHKCKAVVEDFGFDACIDYKEANLPASLKEHCPKDVNVYFDNVGGAILDAVLGRLAPKARVVLCGVISSYLTGEHPGPANYVNLLGRTALMQGFNALDEWGRFDEAFASLRQWEEDGRLVHRKHRLRAADQDGDVTGFRAVHAAGDRAGEGVDPARPASGRKGLDLGEVVGAHLDPGAAAAQMGQRQLENRLGRRRRGQTGDQATDGLGQRGNGIHPVRARGQGRVGGAALQIEDADIESGARQIDGEMFAESPQSNEAVTHMRSHQPSGRSIISRCNGVSST